MIRTLVAHEYEVHPIETCPTEVLENEFFEGIIEIYGFSQKNYEMWDYTDEIARLWTEFEPFFLAEKEVVTIQFSTQSMDLIISDESMRILSNANPRRSLYVSEKIEGNDLRNEMRDAAKIFWKWVKCNGGPLWQDIAEPRLESILS